MVGNRLLLYLPELVVDDDEGTTLAFFNLNTIFQNTAFKRPDLECFFTGFALDLVQYDGGGFSGGTKDVSANACFGVPGRDSHVKGTEPEAPP